MTTSLEIWPIQILYYKIIKHVVLKSLVQNEPFSIMSLFMQSIPCLCETTTRLSRDMCAFIPTRSAGNTRSSAPSPTDFPRRFPHGKLHTAPVTSLRTKTLSTFWKFRWIFTTKLCFFKRTHEGNIPALSWPIVNVTSLPRFWTLNSTSNVVLFNTAIFPVSFFSPTIRI